MMKKLLKQNLALLLMLFVFSNTLSAQQEPIDMILVRAAPNLDWIQRSESTVNVFKGDKFNYSLDVNNSNFNKWLNNYPQEFLAYKTAMDEFFATKNPEDFTSSERDFYYDLKAQYQMLKNLKPW